jgi:hypothetical protein
MRRVSDWFILTGVLFALAGMALGVAMGMVHDFSLEPVHAHVNLLGWTTMALFGLVYKAYDRGAEEKWMIIHYWVTLAGNLLMPVGIYFAVTAEEPGLAIFAALIVLASMVLFLRNFLTIGAA